MSRKRPVRLVFSGEGGQKAEKLKAEIGFYRMEDASL
jgi:hypothetical protein